VVVLVGRICHLGSKELAYVGLGVQVEVWINHFFVCFSVLAIIFWFLASGSNFNLFLDP
jgi:hypothetical protein